MNSWGLLNSGRDKEGHLPLSPWNRYKENWLRHKEDATLKQVVPDQPDGVRRIITSSCEGLVAKLTFRPLLQRILIEEGKPHPIPALMERAKKRWEDLKNRQSKTFAQAVAEYQRRYGRRPPRGFDRWYAFARANNVKLIDEFDLIEHSLRPFRAFEPASFRRRASKAASIINTWRIRVTRGQIYREGELGHHERAQGVLQMCKKFKHELPDMIIGYNGHDGARVNIGWEERMRLEDLIEDGVQEEYLPKDSEMAPIMESPPPGWGIPQTCPTDSKMREEGFEFGDPDKRRTGLEVPPVPSNGVGSLVGGFKEYLDVCNSPQYRHFHAATSWSFQTWPTTVMPLFTPGVHARFGDVYCVIDEQFKNDAPEGLPWEMRKHDKAVWRGQASGPFYESSTPWQSTQRPRLHLMTHNKKGSRALIVADKEGLAKRKVLKNSILNPLFFDAGIVGPAVQCLEEDGTCDKMGQVFQGFDDRLTFEDQEEYKYQLDVDGNSWSGRFRRLMLSNGAVLKATIFQEFWTDWAIPWLHFIPLQVDYSDIYDVMAFFRGGPNGENGHDHLAREIAMAGKAWAKEHMRWEDIEAYTFRQFLEYGRLYNADREGRRPIIHSQRN
ncbi:glycosyltransferase family 90 protein [Cystobasidium minutum MCA 4210]|uniref:glycosyltransferase family 90 protein n=1 Tax=Cystobasidium minutum MCA 4210 TaxID=1397322 RepID=UPI0034CF1FD0|eukprot:jgi/Rhomi1/142953/e_gw1.3.871.1